MRVNYHKLERDIPEIAAHVEAVSGLKVPLNTLKFEIAEAVTERNVIGEYFSSEGKIKMYLNNLSAPFCQNTVKTYLGHEIMHHAQFSVKWFKQTAKKAEAENIPPKMRPLRRLMEGDANWVEHKLRRFYPTSLLSTIYLFPNEIELKYAGIFHINGGEQDRYGLGRRRIDALVAEGGREAVNRLYQAELQEIVDNFSDSIIEKSITSGEKNFRVTIDDAISKVNSSIYRIEKAYEKVKEAVEEKLDRAIDDANSRRLEAYLERHFKTDPEIAELKRDYDEAMNSLKKKV